MCRIAIVTLVKRKSILLSVFILILVFVITAVAQDFNTATKVRFIRIFPKYIEWPSNKKSGDFVIGVVGDAELANALSDAMKEKTVGSQPIKIVQYATGSEIDKCHMVYLSPDKSSDINTVISKGKKNHTLIVTDKEGMISKSSINFVFVDSRLKYELNVKNLTTFGLKYNDNLKTVAAKVIE